MRSTVWRNANRTDWLAVCIPTNTATPNTIPARVSNHRNACLRMYGQLISLSRIMTGLAEPQPEGSDACPPGPPQSVHPAEQSPAHSFPPRADRASPLARWTPASDANRESAPGYQRRYAYQDSRSAHRPAKPVDKPTAPARWRTAASHRPKAPPADDPCATPSQPYLVVPWRVRRSSSSANRAGAAESQRFRNKSASEAN